MFRQCVRVYMLCAEWVQHFSVRQISSIHATFAQSNDGVSVGEFNRLQRARERNRGTKQERAKSLRCTLREHRWKQVRETVFYLFMAKLNVCIHLLQQQGE